ncbi:3-keto-5-aminohexanoate cleavage protein [Chloroflexota bacterium]
MAQQNLEELRAKRTRWAEHHFPIVNVPKIPTMAKKVAIEAAIPGWQPKAWYTERGVHNLPPITFDEQADAIVECVKAGASVIHTHPIDPDTGISAPVNSPSVLPRHTECLMEVMDRVFDKVDVVTAHHTWVTDTSKSLEVDYITHTKQLLEAGKARGVGNRYVQSCLIMTVTNYEPGQPVHSDKGIEEGTKWMEDNGIKPMIEVESFAMPRVKQYLFDSGIAKWKPYWFAIQEGKHGDDRVFADPWASLEVITSMGLARQILGEDGFIGIHPAGRNWLPLATQALMLGAELVRVGIEDIFYLYPHRDDISQKASDSTEIVAKIITALGREIATPQDVRDRVGIKLTK